MGRHRKTKGPVVRQRHLLQATRAEPLFSGTFSAPCPPPLIVKCSSRPTGSRSCPTMLSWLQSCARRQQVSLRCSGRIRALLHLRFIVRSAKPADVTDTTLATELLLLDRCIETLRETMPNARNLQAKIAAHLPDNPDAQRACDNVLTLVRHFLDDSGMQVVSSDVAAGPARELRFRPTMGWLQVK